MKRTDENLAWRKEVLDIDDNKCIICGDGPKFLNAHHLIPKNFKKWRYDVNNGVALCPKHHILGKFSAHKNPMWFSRWLRINKNPLYMIVINRLKEFDSQFDMKMEEKMNVKKHE